MVILEAAAVGVPAIGSDIYGIQDAIVHDVTGTLVPAGDVHTLARTIIEWSKSSSVRVRFGGAARQRVESMFSQQLVIDRYVKFFLSLMDEHSAN